MVRNRVRLLATAGLAALAIPLTLVSGAMTAEAAVIGTLTVNPPSGADDTPMSVVISAGCPTSAAQFQVMIRGSGFPAEGYNIIGSTPLSSLTAGNGGTYSIVVSDTLRNYAAQQTPPATLNGRYDLTLTCRTALSPASLGDFTGAIQFDTPTTYHSLTGTPTPTGTPTSTPTSTPTGSPTPTDTATPTETPFPTATDQSPGGQQNIGVSVGSGSGGSGAGGSGSGSSGGSGSAGQLPNTGVTWVSELTVLGLWLVVVGMLVVALARSRRPGAAEPGSDR